MALVEVKAPAVGESITEVIIGEWLKSPGDWVEEDESVVVVESDKVNMEVPAPQAGVLVKAVKAIGDTALVGELIAQIDPNATASAAPANSANDSASQAASTESHVSTPDTRVTPAARRLLAEKGLSSSDVKATGPGGRLLKEDVLRHQSKPATTQKASSQSKSSFVAPAVAGSREEETVPMSPIRRTVARRLLEAQQSAAILSTFNEVDMSAIMALRKRYQDSFIKRYDMKLGFMSFFVKAVVEALKIYPEVNARIEDKSIVYHHYYDIGIAVGGGKGLVVPVIRNAESLGFAEIEATIRDFGQRAQKNRITLEELQGGTFSITNGGIYGSLLSTPILNPPQSGILGMHGIQDRPMAVNGEVVIRPMMYIALSYDHRIVDGKGAVSFLKHVKELLEDPQRILLEL